MNLQITNDRYDRRKDLPEANQQGWPEWIRGGSESPWISEIIDRGTEGTFLPRRRTRDVRSEKNRYRIFFVFQDLFTLTADTVSLTHDLMNCSCSGKNNEHISLEQFKAADNGTRDCQFALQDKPPQQNLTINQLSDWQHYKQPVPPDITEVTKLSPASAKPKEV